MLAGCSTSVNYVGTSRQGVFFKVPKTWDVFDATALKNLGLAVNAAAKQLVGRERPDRSDRASGELLSVRAPRSASFPSGHTLAAFCTAVVLADGPAERTAYLALATAVGASRIHLGDHHASDVVGGAAIGIVLGTALRALGRRDPSRRGRE